MRRSAAPLDRGLDGARPTADGPLLNKILGTPTRTRGFKKSFWVRLVFLLILCYELFMYSHNAVDMTGQVFGNLTVLKRAGRRKRLSGGFFSLWTCRCTCGATVVKLGMRLRQGRVKSCGINGHRSYGGIKGWRGGITTKHRSEYSSWQHMRRRCLDLTSHKYRLYGGRGITICPQWVSSFEQFLEDMGSKPSLSHTIDRIDTNGNYEPANCRWATHAEQSRNMRNNFYVEHEGKRVLLIDLVGDLGLSYSVVKGRLAYGWLLQEALGISVRPKVKNGQGKKYVRKVRLPPVATPWDD